MEQLRQEELDYLVNLVESEKRDWNKAIIDLNYNVHPDTLKKSFNVGRYSGYNVYKYMLEKLENEFLSDEEVLRLETLRDEEYKERVKLQDANREKRKVLRDFSRIENLQEYIEKKLDEREPINFKFNTYEIKNGNEASALVSDLHCGATVDSIFNFYNKNVLKERLEQLSSKIIGICLKDKVTHLNVEFLGDFITGIIHGSTIAQAEEDVIDQIFDACDILTEFIISLRKKINTVKVYITYGNHGRSNKNKSESPNRENFERLIAPYIRKELRKTDIKIIDGGYEDFITYNLKRNNELIVGTHGTNDNPNNANMVFSKLLEKNVYEVHMGHFHSVKEGKGTTVNGSVMGGDDYSISHRWNEKPIQVLKVYYNDTFDDASYKLGLD